MAIGDFNMLDNAGKEQLISTRGNFTIHFEAGQKRCDVYELDGFYVGFFYDRHANQQAKIVAVISPEKLPYM